MNLPQMLDWLKQDPSFQAGVRRWEVLPEQPARYGGFPGVLDERLVDALKARGVHDLYTHQSQAVSAALEGRSTVVVTPTASGKTLCYNLPVLHTIMQATRGARALPVPTKALAQDQLAELTRVDRSGWAWRSVRTSTTATRRDRAPADPPGGQIVVTNPDMLHTGILPHHTRWVAPVRELAVHRDRRTAHVSRRVRLAPGQRAAAAPADLRLLRQQPSIPLFQRHHSQSPRAR